MAFTHIPSLYKDRSILNFRRIYALEKVHGTGAAVLWLPDTGELRRRCNAGDPMEFRNAMPQDLIENLRARVAKACTIHGEFHGGHDGKGQGMRATYGDESRFVVFDIRFGDVYLDVPKAEKLATSLGFEFVHYDEIDGTQEACDAARDAPSVQAIRRGLGNDKRREGVVLRPLIELRKNNGTRMIAKHRRAEFCERASGEPRAFDPERDRILTDAEEIAHEWVVPNRLDHVLDKLSPRATTLRDVRRVLDAMVEDVTREAAGEIVWSLEVQKAVSRRASELYIARVQAGTL